MALLKDVTLDTGIVAGYWRITSAQTYFTDGVADLTVSGWTDSTAAAATPALVPLLTRVIRIQVSPILSPPQTISDLRVPLYALLNAALTSNPSDPLYGATAG
jgi:hypothetical protein